MKILSNLRFGADGSNRFCETGNVFVCKDGVASENRSSVSNCSWPFDAGLGEEKRSTSFFTGGGGGEVASFFYKSRLENDVKSAGIPTLLK